MDTARIAYIRERTCPRGSLHANLTHDLLDALEASQAEVARLKAEVERVRFEIEDVRILADRCDISYQEAFFMARAALAPSTDKKEADHG